MKDRHSTCACSENARRKNTRISQNLSIGRAYFYSNDELISTSMLLEYRNEVGTDLGGHFDPPSCIHSRSSHTAKIHLEGQSGVPSE